MLAIHFTVKRSEDCGAHKADRPIVLPRVYNVLLGRVSNVIISASK